MTFGKPLFKTTFFFVVLFVFCVAGLTAYAEEKAAGREVTLTPASQVAVPKTAKPKSPVPAIAPNPLASRGAVTPQPTESAAVTATNVVKRSEVASNRPPENLDEVSITKMQQNLEALSARYEDLRNEQSEQIVTLRTLSTQAKIHAQVLEDIKKTLPPKIPKGVPASGLDALNLEKYRLISERLKAQQSSVDAITESQMRLRATLSAVQAARTAVPEGLDAVKMAKNARGAQTAAREAEQEREELLEKSGSAKSALGKEISKPSKPIS